MHHAHLCTVENMIQEFHIRLYLRRFCYPRVEIPNGIHSRIQLAYQHTIESIHHCSIYIHHVHICRLVHPRSQDNLESYHILSKARCTCHRHNRILFCGHMFALAQLKFVEEENWICSWIERFMCLALDAYGSLTRHFHPYIQIFLNSGNDQRCMIYPRTEIDPHDMWCSDSWASFRHHLQDNPVRRRISNYDGCKWFRPYIGIPLEHMSMAFCDGCYLSLCNSGIVKSTFFINVSFDRTLSI